MDTSEELNTLRDMMSYTIIDLLGGYVTIRMTETIYERWVDTTKARIDELAKDEPVTLELTCTRNEWADLRIDLETARRWALDHEEYEHAAHLLYHADRILAQLEAQAS